MRLYFVFEPYILKSLSIGLNAKAEKTLLEIYLGIPFLLLLALTYWIIYLRSKLKLIRKYSVKWDKKAQAYCPYHESLLSPATKGNGAEVFFCSVCGQKIAPMDKGKRIGRNVAINKMKEQLNIKT